MKLKVGDRVVVVDGPNRTWKGIIITIEEKLALVRDPYSKRMYWQLLDFLEKRQENGEKE